MSIIVLFSNCAEKRNSLIVEGLLDVNPNTFESFYGINDSITKVLKDSFQIIINSDPTSEYLISDIKGYKFLERENLLDKPCKLFSTDIGKIRVYLEENAFYEIERLKYYSEDKSLKPLTYFKMELEFLKNGIEGVGDIYKCIEILNHRYSEIPEGKLELDEDIEVEPSIKLNSK